MCVHGSMAAACTAQVGCVYLQASCTAHAFYMHVLIFMNSCPTTSPAPCWALRWVLGEQHVAGVLAESTLLLVPLLGTGLPHARTPQLGPPPHPRGGFGGGPRGSVGHKLGQNTGSGISFHHRSLLSYLPSAHCVCRGHLCHSCHKRRVSDMLWIGHTPELCCLPLPPVPCLQSSIFALFK